jgi:hypothetical protein
MGTAAMGTADPNSLVWCTCKRTARAETAALPSRNQQRIDELERQVLSLKARLADL